MYDLIGKLKNLNLLMCNDFFYEKKTIWLNIGNL